MVGFKERYNMYNQWILILYIGYQTFQKKNIISSVSLLYIPCTVFCNRYPCRSWLHEHRDIFSMFSMLLCYQVIEPQTVAVFRLHISCICASAREILVQWYRYIVAVDGSLLWVLGVSACLPVMGNILNLIAGNPAVILLLLNSFHWSHYKPLVDRCNSGWFIDSIYLGV